ncbi:hypothetical protein [Pseudooceanicola aestuarii]|uniref:hypothetical protein n=1 Tax=Pseudooceanicola aestuarii TaxID=2697319 RepID=UPI0013CF5CD6|nr:hypothetical protein [Pseudooceanicola aestuarii]
MATASTTLTQETGLRGKLDAFFVSMGQGFNAYLERRARTEQIEALNAKSDAELAKLGITRDAIPAYVFRDLFYI